MRNFTLNAASNPSKLHLISLLSSSSSWQPRTTGGGSFFGWIAKRYQPLILFFFPFKKKQPHHISCFLLHYMWNIKPKHSIHFCLKKKREKKRKTEIPSSFMRLTSNRRTICPRIFLFFFRRENPSEAHPRRRCCLSPPGISSDPSFLRTSKPDENKSSLAVSPFVSSASSTPETFPPHDRLLATETFLSLLPIRVSFFISRSKSSPRIAFVRDSFPWSDEDRTPQTIFAPDLFCLRVFPSWLPSCSSYLPSSLRSFFSFARSTKGKGQKKP